MAVTTEQVWHEVERANFAVIGMVNAHGQARTAGVVIAAENRRVYFSSGRQAWKIRHIQANSYVSLTVAIPKRVPLLPMIKVPAATITFHGEARLIDAREVSSGVVKALTGGLELDEDTARDMAFVEIQPEGDFVTYGVGLRVDKMRDTAFARGRAPVE